MFEAGIALRQCGLERCGRRDVLDALSYFTDRKTGLASVSDVALAHHTGLSERSIRRILKSLIEDDDLDCLVQVVSRGQGRGRRSTYRMDLSRIEPLGQAVMLARRAAHAGVSKALADRKLTGRALTPDNIRRVFKCLLHVLSNRRYAKVRLAVVDLASQFEVEFAAFRAQVKTVKKPLSAFAKRMMRLHGRRQNVVQTAVDKLCKTYGFKGAKPDKMTVPYNRDNNPSGISPLTPHSGQTVRAEAVKQGRFILSSADLVAEVAGWRDDRRAFLADFGRRPAEVNRNGVITVLCASWSEANRLSERWMEGMMRYARNLGLEGVVFAAEEA